MNKKLKKPSKFSVVALCISLIFCLTAFMMPTLSKYVTITNAPFGEDDTLDYTVNAVFEVKNQDELFAAINQGYTYVQLSKDIENPLIVTEKAETLDADLILDLNGIEIQRNGYDPILNIKEGVRLTVVDTSSEQTGGLYNPVGSVFNITGGILTVVAGTFESGPRYSEYYSYNTDILNSENATTKRTVVEPTAQTVKYYARTDDVLATEPTEILAPIIKSYPTVTGDITYNHGNLYFDHTVTMGAITITPDTYCYYRTSADKSASNNSEVACDWYYTYWVDVDTYTYVGTELPSGATEEDHVLITIYGYEGAIQTAASRTEAKDYSAAIQMQAGTLEVQKGGFYSYFGVDTTACVNSQGGKITVKNGEFSSRVPDAYNSINDGVNIKEDDSLAFDTDYFKNYRWSTETNGNLAKQGESYCILNGGNATVDIGNGKFYSSDNSTIHMSGGSLDIGAGTVSKKTTNAPPASQLTPAQAAYFSAIHMKDGELSVKNATFNVLGDRAIGMFMEKGLLNVSNANCNLSGDNVFGIVSTVSGNNSFNVKNTSFTLNGDYATGIYSANGKVNVSADESSAISVEGANGKGIHVLLGGSVYSEKYSYTLNGDNSIGIYAEDDATGIDISNGFMNISGYQSFGIKSEIIDDDNSNDDFNVANLPITMTNGTEQTGIFSQGGRVNLSATSATTISIEEASGKGLHVGSGGSVISDNYSYELTGDTSHGIYSTAGLVRIAGGDITLTSNQSCYGVYAFSESETIQVDISGATIDVGYNFTNNKSGTVRSSVGVFLATNDNTNTITLTDTNIKCYEVGVLIDGGSLEVKSTNTEPNQILTRKASSIVVKGGGINFDQSCNYEITSYTTTNSAYSNVFNITLPTIDESVNEAYDNYDGIYVDGGNLISNGNVTISHAGLYNDISNWTYYDNIVIKSYAVRVLNGEVELNKANITNSVGGGVMCNGGDVTLGNSQSEQSDITITTTGHTMNDSWTRVVDNAKGEWTVHKTVDGGHAVEINGGNLTAYHGTYTASYGDGIKLFAGKYTDEDLADGVEMTTVNIHNGTFKGNMTGEADHQISGPAACYGVKVFGSATINIYDGVFDGRGGGACVSGVTDYLGGTSFDASEDYPANVYIYKGQFGSESATDGFMIYEYANIIFGAAPENYFGTDDSVNYRLNAISIKSVYAPFSLNFIAYENNTASAKSAYVAVYYGTYTGAYYGWNKGDAASDVQLYNTEPGLTYSSGTSNAGAVTIHYNTTTYYYPQT